MKRLKLRDKTLPWIYLAPLLLLLALFRCYPLIRLFSLGIGAVPLVRLVGDAQFALSFRNTLLTTAAIPVASVVLSYLTALLFQMSRRKRVRKLSADTPFMIQYMMPAAVLALLFRHLFSYHSGAINALLTLFGAERMQWLYDYRLTLPVLVIFETAHFLPFGVLFFLRSLSAVDRDSLAAADCDGATFLQKIRLIVAPLTLRDTLFLLILSAITSSKIYTSLFILFNDSAGINDSGSTLVWYLLSHLRSGRIRAAAAAALSLLPVTLALSILRGRLDRKNRIQEEYDRTPLFLIASRPAAALAAFLKLLVAAAMLFPFCMMAATAFQSGAFPENFIYVVRESRFFLYMGNSLVIALIVPLLTLSVIVPAAFALSHFRFSGSRAVAVFSALALALPMETLAVQNTLTVARLGLLDSFAAIALPYGLSVFYLLYLKNRFDAIPASYMEEAKTGGCGSFALLWRVVLPLSRQPILFVGLMRFLTGWNLFFWPLLVAGSDRYPLSVGVVMLKSASGSDLSIEMAALTLITAPVIIGYALYALCFSRRRQKKIIKTP